jgi:hypothetical protein
VKEYAADAYTTKLMASRMMAVFGKHYATRCMRRLMTIGFVWRAVVATE